MGGTSNSTQTSSATLAPYSPASGPMNGILGQLGSMAPQAGTLNAGQTDALGRVISSSQGTPNFQPQINAGSYGLLNGGGAQSNDAAIKSNLGGYSAGMSTYTDPNYSTVNSAPVRAALNQVATDTTNNVNGSFAAAGRDGSPGNTQALARGIASAEAPIILNQANQDTATRTGALNSVYGAGNNTYGILNGNQAQANTNFSNGIGSIGAGVTANNAAPTAEINAASQYFGIPASQLQTLLGSISPVAAQFGTQNGQSQGTQTMSGAQQFATIANGFGSLIPKGNIR